MGLLDQFSETLSSNPAAQQGLLNFGLALMGSRGMNLGQAIGQAGLSGLESYNQENQRIANKKRADLQDQMLQMQVDQQKQALAKQKAFQDAYAAATATPDYGGTVARPIQDQQYGQVIGGPALQAIGPKTMQTGQMQAMALPADLQAAVKAYQASGDPVGAMKLISDYKATLPKYSAQNILGKDAQGNLVQYSVNDQGQATALPFMPAEKLDKVNLGNRVVTMGEYTGQPKGQMAIGVSPDAQLSNAVAWANYGLGKQRLGLEQANANKPQVVTTDQGLYAVNPRQPNQAVPVMSEGQQIGKGVQNAQKDAADALNIVQQARQILPSASGSFLGAVGAGASNMLGLPSDTAKANAQLKVLGGALVSKMPKMSGPQSDKDVALYKEMAGNIGDDTLPISTRLAALDQVEKLQNYYMQNPKGAAPTAPGKNVPAVPMKGQVIGGYKFKGGDPSDQNNWVQQ